MFPPFPFGRPPPAPLGCPQHSAAPAPTLAPTVLKLCLQVLVCVTIALRCMVIFGHLRKLWMADGLAGEFRRELRRRGLLMAPPVLPGDPRVLPRHADQ